MAKSVVRRMRNWVCKPQTATTGRQQVPLFYAHFNSSYFRNEFPISEVYRSLHLIGSRTKLMNPVKSFDENSYMDLSLYKWKLKQ